MLSLKIAKIYAVAPSKLISYFSTESKKKAGKKQETLSVSTNNSKQKLPEILKAWIPIISTFLLRCAAFAASITIGIHTNTDPDSGVTDWKAVVKEGLRSFLRTFSAYIPFVGGLITFIVLYYYDFGGHLSDALTNLKIIIQETYVKFINACKNIIGSNNNNLGFNDFHNDQNEELNEAKNILNSNNIKPLSYEHKKTIFFFNETKVSFIKKKL